jgi:hypothetical protein
MACSPNANRQSTEFAANASSARTVDIRVLTKLFLDLSLN